MFRDFLKETLGNEINVFTTITAFNIMR